MRCRCAVAILAAMTVQAACGHGPSARANAGLRTGALRGSNVLLVTIDTLRADRLGSYGGGSLTPTLDALAARGVRFTQAHAHAPLTLPAHTSIMTGLIPPTHGVHNNGSTALAPSVPTLATILHDAGYRTGAFVGAFVLDARFGLSRGFDTYDDRVGGDTGPITFAFAERSADRVTQLAGEWILTGGLGQTSPQAPVPSPQSPSPQSRASSPEPRAPTPWFAWIHLFDPHAPYHAPEQRVANPYDNEVAFADAQLGRLVDRLRAAGQLDSTLIVVLADHGESLGEHGEKTHGLFAYEATLHIPLIIAAPALHVAVVETPVGQADVLPTVVDLLGLPAPARIEGQSLAPSIRGEPLVDRAIYFEALDAYLTRNWAPLTGVVAGGWKFIDLPDPELYDLSHDRGETRNVIRSEASRAATLGQKLTAWAKPSAQTAAARPPLDADAAARLRSLGYTATQATSDGRKRFGLADDPKRLLDVDRRYEQALTLTGDRRFAEAAALLRGVVADRPDFTVAYLNLASVLIAGGQPQEAVAALQQAAARGVDGAEIQGRLGAAYLAAGDLKRAQAALEPVSDPSLAGGLEALNSLGVVWTQTGHHDRARRAFASVLDRSPHSATTWNNLGLLELSGHRADQAARAFEQAVAADPRFAQAWEGLGAARLATDPSGAVEAWRRALELEPRNYDLLFNIAVLLHDRGRAFDARPYLERFAREAPPDRYARDIARFRAWLTAPSK
jgi:arylsulfatase A-like enzyme/Tfp pilus assembly protein PilF